MIAPLFYARLGLRKYASIAINGSTRGLRIYASIAINRLIQNGGSFLVFSSDRFSLLSFRRCLYCEKLLYCSKFVGWEGRELCYLVIDKL